MKQQWGHIGAYYDATIGVFGSRYHGAVIGRFRGIV